MGKKYDGTITFNLAATFENTGECYRLGECYAMPLEYHKRADRRANKKHRNFQYDYWRHNERVYFAGIDTDHHARREGKRACYNYMQSLPQEQYLDAVGALSIF